VFGAIVAAPVLFIYYAAGVKGILSEIIWWAVFLVLALALGNLPASVIRKDFGRPKLALLIQVLYPLVLLGAFPLARIIFAGF